MLPLSLQCSAETMYIILQYNPTIFNNKGKVTKKYFEKALRIPIVDGNWLKKEIQGKQILLRDKQGSRNQGSTVYHIHVFKENSYSLLHMQKSNKQKGLYIIHINTSDFNTSDCWHKCHFKKRHKCFRIWSIS